MNGEAAGAAHFNPSTGAITPLAEAARPSLQGAPEGWRSGFLQRLRLYASSRRKLEDLAVCTARQMSPACKQGRDHGQLMGQLRNQAQLIRGLAKANPRTNPCHGTECTSAA